MVICDLIWNMVFILFFVVITIFGIVIKTFKSDCFVFGGVNFVFMFGFIFDVDVIFVLRMGGIGIEIGVGFDMTG